MSSQETPVIPHNFVKHKDAWREALENMVRIHRTGSDDYLYWTHELKAYDEAHAELAKLPGVPCEGCGGSGIALQTADYAALNNVPSGYVAIQRCDTCEKYASDYDAAVAFGDDAKVFGPNELAIARPRAKVVLSSSFRFDLESRAVRVTLEDNSRLKELRAQYLSAIVLNRLTRSEDLEGGWKWGPWGEKRGIWLKSPAGQVFTHGDCRQFLDTLEQRGFVVMPRDVSLEAPPEYDPTNGDSAVTAPADKVATPGTPVEANTHLEPRHYLSHTFISNGASVAFTVTEAGRAFIKRQVERKCLERDITQELFRFHLTHGWKRNTEMLRLTSPDGVEYFLPSNRRLLEAFETTGTVSLTRVQEQASPAKQSTLLSEEGKTELQKFGETGRSISDQEADTWFMNQPEEFRRKLNEQVTKEYNPSSGGAAAVRSTIQRRMIKEAMTLQDVLKSGFKGGATHTMPSVAQTKLPRPALKVSARVEELATGLELAEAETTLTKGPWLESSNRELMLRLMAMMPPGVMGHVRSPEESLVQEPVPGRLGDLPANQQEAIKKGFGPSVSGTNLIVTPAEDLQSQLNYYRGLVVWGMHEDATPHYTQGKAGEHEICEPLTAKAANNMVQQIEDMRRIAILMKERIRDLANDKDKTWADWAGSYEVDEVLEKWHVKHPDTLRLLAQQAAVDGPNKNRNAYPPGPPKFDKTPPVNIDTAATEQHALSDLLALRVLYEARGDRLQFAKDALQAVMTAPQPSIGRLREIASTAIRVITDHEKKHAKGEAWAAKEQQPHPLGNSLLTLAVDDPVGALGRFARTVRDITLLDKPEVQKLARIQSFAEDVLDGHNSHPEEVGYIIPRRVVGEQLSITLTPLGITRLIELTNARAKPADIVAEMLFWHTLNAGWKYQYQGKLRTAVVVPEAGRFVLRYEQVIAEWLTEKHETVLQRSNKAES
jgi:hypothetical protein